MNEIKITSAINKQNVLNKMLKENNNELYGVDFISFTQLLALQQDNLTALEQYFNLKKLPLNNYQKAIEDLTFVDELINIAKQCDLNSINIDELKNEDFDKELKLIIKALKINNFSKLKTNYFNKQKYQIILYENEKLTYEEEIIYQELKNKQLDIKFINDENQNKNNNVGQLINVKTPLDQFNYTLQDIIIKNRKLSDCVFILGKPEEKSLLNLSLAFYNIPYSNDNITIVNRKFIALLKYRLLTNEENLRNIIALNIFTNKTASLLIYLDNYTDGSLINPSGNYKEREGFVEDIKKEITILKKNINTILSSSFKDFLLNSYNWVTKNADEEENDILYNLLLENGGAILKVENKTDENFAIKYLIQELEKITNKKNINTLTITNLNNLTTNKKYLYLFSISQMTFPNFPKLSSFLRQEYLIKQQPDITKKIQKAHLDYLAYLLTSCEEANYLNSIVDYEGVHSTFPLELIDNYNPFKLKSLEPSFLSPKAFNIEKTFNSHQINSQLVKKYFYNEEGKIKSSISALETYVKCPYHYFITKGLKLKRVKREPLDAAFVGQVMHKFFESACKKDPSNYYFYKEEDIEEIIKDEFDERLKIYPQAEQLLLTSKKRIIKTLKQELELLQNDNSKLKFAEAEYKMEVHWPYNSNLIMKSIIDRLDKYQNGYRIIDYKSSEHKLETKKIRTGEQLQLLTYLLLYQELYPNQIPIGAFYASLKQSSYNQKYFSFTKTSGLKEIIACEPKKELLAKRKLNGFVLSEQENLLSFYFDNEPQKINIYTNMKTNKQSFNDSALWDYKQIKEALKEIYNSILNDLDEGKFSNDIRENDLEYCEFKALCNHTNIIDELKERTNKLLTLSEIKKEEKEQLKEGLINE